MKGYKSPCSEQTKRHKTDPLNSFYIYIHSRQSDGKPFYVGKGCGYRAWVFKGRNNWWHKMHDKHGVDVEILFDGLTAEESYSTEKDVILELEYFGYHLVNLTSGGDGGYSVSLETRKKQSQAKIGVFCGINNPYADINEYTFVRVSDNFEITCTRHHLCDNYRVNKSLIKKLFYTKPRRTACGWRLKGTT